MPRIIWRKLAEHKSSDGFTKYRAEMFCCSSIYVKRDINCKICTADHAMIERRMACTSPSCAKKEEVLGGTQCAVQWKTWECMSHSLWHVYTNGEKHLRDEACIGAHRVPITSEVRQFVTRMDACGMQPRHIWSNLRRAPDVPAPPLGLPSRQQITDCVKRLRRKNLTRNTRQGVKSLAKEYPYYDGIDDGKAFLFAPDFEDDGFPRIGKGSDADPFVIGVTTLSLLTKVNQLCGDGHFRLFHTDATFKLSDLGYPVITCGFTDRSRTYHLAAILIVSARTYREYELAFGSFAKLYQRIFGASLRVDAIMGDAEDAQLNALRNIAVFSESKYLMCFFHVLYNVHKRTRHLNTGQGVAVFSGIMDMHFTTSYLEYCSVRDRTISEWRMVPSLNTFADYFEEQWIQSRFWRWQIYHSPSSYATTNNPCEVFNACVKRHVQRKTSEICTLIRSMITLTEDVGCDVPSPSASIAAPNPEIKRTAKWMLKAKAVMVIRTRDASQVRVLHILESHFDAEAMATMREMANAAIGDHESEDFSFPSLILNKSQKRSASRLYCDSVKWSTRRAHRVNMPRDGWLVNAEENNCACSMHVKFGICSHIMVARSVLGIGNNVEFGEKLVCRRARKKRRKTQSIVVPPVTNLHHVGVYGGIQSSYGAIREGQEHLGPAQEMNGEYNGIDSLQILSGMQASEVIHGNVHNGTRHNNGWDRGTAWNGSVNWINGWNPPLTCPFASANHSMHFGNPVPSLVREGIPLQLYPELIRPHFVGEASQHLNSMYDPSSNTLTVSDQERGFNSPARYVEQGSELGGDRNTVWSHSTNDILFGVPSPRQVGRPSLAPSALRL